MELKHRKGQSFILGALLFSGLFIVAFIPSGPDLNRQPSSNFNSYFQQALDEKTDNFNQELKQKKTIDNVKRGVYNYNRFLEESSSTKGITYESYSLAVFPDDGEYVFINYQNQDANVSIHVDGSWNNQTVQSNQFVEGSFSAGRSDVKLLLNDRAEVYIFDAFKPRYVYWMRMSGEDETWQNSFIG